MRDIRLAVRNLARTPWITAVAIGSLALGIGANAAIFSMMDAMLLRALPVLEPERLVNLEVPGPNPGSQSCGQAGGCDEVLSYPMLRDLEAFETPSVAGLAGHVPFAVNLAFEGRTTHGTGVQVTGGYFPVLGVRPALGRLLDPEDDREVGAHRVAVLSHAYWQTELGGDPEVLNRTLVVNGQALTVVGVAARGFRGTVLGSDPDVYVPMTLRGELNPWFDGWENRRWYWAYAFARLAPGATIDQAAQELSTYYNGIIREVEAPLQSSMTDDAMARFLEKEVVLAAGYRGQSNTHEEVETPLRILLGLTALVLFIACANIANLLLARGAARRTEMAVRGSLGATRGQLLRQLLTESMILAVLGGAFGVVLGFLTLEVITGLVPPELLQGVAVGMDPGVLAFTGAVALATGFLFGVYPAIHATRADLATLIRAGSGKDSGARSATRFRTVLVTAQIALSLALLAGAGLFARSLGNVAAVELGQDTGQVLQFAVSPELNGYAPEAAQALYTALHDELAATPGVTAVASSLVPVLGGDSWGNDVSVEGYDWEPGMDANSRFNAVGPGFFSAIGMPLLSGREFTEADRDEAPRVAVVNETFATTFGLDPRTAVGKRMKRGTGPGDLDMEIVGIVRDARYARVKEDVPPVFFVPFRQEGSVGGLHYYLRIQGDREALVSEVRRRVAGLDPNLPIEELRMLDDTIRDSLALDRLIGVVSGAFALLATLLAAVGLYGVLSFAVAQRTREIGVRMALGADRSRVRGMVLRQVSVMAALGGIAGLGAAYGLGRVARSLLFGVGATDVLVLALATAVIVGVALAAAYLPARRASRVEPVVALRHE